jgi:hypothetical protein
MISSLEVLLLWGCIAHMHYAVFLYLFSLTTLYSFAIDTINTDTRYYKSGPYQQINLASSTRNSRRFSRLPKYHSDYRHSDSHSIDLWTCSAFQLAQYFFYHRYTEEEILSQNRLYMSDEFVTLAKTYTGYKAAITDLYNQFKGLGGFLCKVIGFCKSQYCPGLQKRIKKLYQEIQNRRQGPCKYDCQKQLIAALESHNNKNTFVYAIDQITQQVLDKASRQHYPIHRDVEVALDISIDMLKITDNPDVFLFHTSFVDHVLCDIEDQVSGRANQRSTLLERAPALLTRAVTTFFKALNPVTQVKNTCEFVASTAHFVADVTLGKLYLSETQYKQRIDNFWSTCAALSPSNLAKLEAEQWVDLAVQLAADFVFFGGIGKAVVYLNEIAAVSKAQQSAVRITQKLKNAVDISLAENPILITAEGIIFRSDKMKQLGGATKEVISNSRKLLESARTGLLANLEKEMTHLRKLFDGKMKGFAEFSNKYLKLDYEHIFGIELGFSRRGMLFIEGFHHDIMNLLEKSGVIEFSNKIVYENGFYKATLLHNGHIAKKIATFFPAHWSREQVVSKIYEAYENFVKSGIQAELKKDKYLVRGLTNEGVPVEMYITRKGHMVTAYPIL